MFIDLSFKNQSSLLFLPILLANFDDVTYMDNSIVLIHANKRKEVQK